MVTIRIVSGCYGARVDGKLAVIEKGHTVDVHEDEAAYLVDLGVAVVEKEPVLKEAPADDDEEKKLQDMSFEQLKKLAADRGLPVGKLRSKKNIIKALEEADASEEDGDEEPPSLGAEAPVL